MSDRIKALVGFGRVHASLARSVGMLRRVGFQPTDASAADDEVAGDEAITRDSSQSTAEGAATGASAGAVVGGVLGWLAGIGSLGRFGYGGVYRRRPDPCVRRRSRRGGRAGWIARRPGWIGNTQAPKEIAAKGESRLS